MAAKDMVQPTGCIEMLLIDKLSGAKYSFKHQLYHTRGSYWLGTAKQFIVSTWNWDLLAMELLVCTSLLKMVLSTALFQGLPPF